MAYENRKIALVVAALSLTAIFAATVEKTAYAALSPEESRSRVEGRQAHMREHAVALYNLEKQLKSDQPNWAEAAIYAQQFVANSRDMASWFAPGTDSNSGTATAARSEIWRQPENFRRNREALVGETEKLLAAVTARDLVEAKRRYNATAEVCKACHAQFRAEDRIEKLP
jgi:cytochrome c556